MKKPRFWIGNATILAVLLACGGAVGVQKDSQLSAEEKARHVESFEKVWKTIGEKHWDKEMEGVDWQAVHDEFQPKVAAASTAGEMRRLMRDMIKRLKLSHYGLIASAAFEDLEKNDAAPKGSGSPHIDVRVVKGRALVTKLGEKSTAGEKGVKTGWEVLAVEGKEVEPMIQRISESYADSTQLDMRLSRSVLARMTGRVGDTVEVTFLDENEKEVTLDLDLFGPKGKKVTFGHMYPIRYWFESEKLDSNIGYITFSCWFDPPSLMKSMEEAVSSFSGTDGIILDLRGNPGGMGGLAMGMAGWFYNEKNNKLGTMHMRDSKIKFVVFPRVEPYLGPLAILIDGTSASTTEIFSGGMKDLGRARLFGSRTAGAALPSTFEKLPNGDRFQYAIANYISESGQRLEGVGVSPHAEILPERAALLEGRDPILDAAVQWIQEQKQANAVKEKQ